MSVRGIQTSSTGVYLHTSKQTQVFFSKSKQNSNFTEEKKEISLHRVVSLGPATKFRLHHMQCPLVQGTGENIFWNGVSRPDMMPGQYPHMPPPLPVKGLCVDGDDGHRPSSARQRRTLQLDSRMESMGGG